MNWQKDIAQQQVLPIYQKIEGIVCVLLVGSVARNLQNEYSDIDCVIYWRDIPSELQRRQVIESANGVVPEIGDSSEGEIDIALQSQAEVFYLYGDRTSGMKIDVTHKTIKSVDKLIQDVVESHETKRIKLAILHSLQRSMTLYGKNWMDSCLAQIGKSMPLPICEALIIQHMRFKPVWIYEQFAMRPDPIHYHQLRLENIENMLRVLGAVNRIYMPYEFKHLEAFIDELNIKTDNLMETITKILQSSPEKSKPLMQSLGDAIYKLIADCFPQIDIQEAHDFFHYVRPKHNRSPLKEDSIK